MAIRNAWQSASSLTVTNLNSLATANIWMSDPINGIGGTNEYPGVEISYQMTISSGPAAGDTLEIFYVSPTTTDPDYPAGEGRITLAATVTKFRDNVVARKRVVCSASSETDQYGSFMIDNPVPGMRIAVYNGAAVGLAATGNTIQVRFFQPEEPA